MEKATPAVESVRLVNTYLDFQRSEGVPVIGGFAVDDLRQVELAPWPRKGGRGTYINLDGAAGTNDAYIVEIPPAGSLNPQRHLYEEMIYVLEGNGSTSVWYDERRKASFEWGPSSLFAIPPNAWHRHFNGRGSKPARYVAVTNAPLLMNLFHNLRFVFDNPFVFDDRFAGQENYFEGEGHFYRGPTGRTTVLETNFVPDVTAIELYAWKERGAGSKSIMFELAHNTMAAHISQFPVGTYKKAHRHGPGAHVIILSGKGYTLLWPQAAEFTKVDWKVGSMVVPPDQWYHQHFNGGAEPARYLALRWGSQRYDLAGAISANDQEAMDADAKQGGFQIEYEDEDRRIHQIFETELARSGATCRMRSMITACTGQE